MSKSSKKEWEKLFLELDRVRSMPHLDKRRQEDPLFNTQLNFWIESVRFCITELEIWDKQVDFAKCNETIAPESA
jgi:hypothetical protein